jgi:spermidine synthase
VGSIAGGVLFSFVLIRSFDHFSLLCFPAFLSLALAALLAFRLRAKILLTTAGAAAVALAGLVAVVNVDAVSTAMQFPQQKVVFSGSSPYGKLVVTESSGQFNFIENGLPLISTHNAAQVEETVHYAMAQRPGAQNVLLVSGGISGTAREILKYGVTNVTYVELDPLIIDAGRRFLPESLADPRIRVVNTDGRLFIRQTAAKFDVVIVDVPDPSTSQINRFYTAEFFGEVKRALNEGGVISFALGQYASYVSPQLARLLSSANMTLKESFKNSLMIPGGRIYFLASDGDLTAAIAARIEENKVPTQWVRRSYLDATLTPDRLADLQRAASQPAAVNRDFSPVLYFYHLLYWISQFRTSLGILEIAIAAALTIYLLRLRAVPFAIFASGFAACGLEVVLLLGFQILCGSLYQQVGVIVTVFMAGLAVGAALANRLSPRADRRRLAMLAFAIAVLAALLPPALQALAGGSSLLAIKALVSILTFVLAALVGMQFPLAGRAQGGVAAATASRLYTADFLGAFLGALLPSVFLIPVFGVTTACIVTAGLNLIGGMFLLYRKA